MTDEEIADGIIAHFEAYDDWHPWRDFRLAECAGLSTRYFIRHVGGALRGRKWPGGPIDSSTEREEYFLSILRDRARKGCNSAVREAPRLRDEVEFPNTDYRQRIRFVSKRGGDIRKFSVSEINQVTEETMSRYPLLSDTIVTAQRYNRQQHDRDPNNRQIDVYRWTLEPLKHAIFHLDPELDSIDNSALAYGVFRELTARALGA